MSIVTIHPTNVDGLSQDCNKCSNIANAMELLQYQAKP